jgi:hypothetical protein
MRQRETSEVLIKATMFPGDPDKRAVYERAARTRAKPNPVTSSIREQIEQEIWGAVSLRRKGSSMSLRKQIEQEIDRAAGVTLSEGVLVRSG